MLYNKLNSHFFKKHFCQIKDKPLFNNVYINKNNSKNYFLICESPLSLPFLTTFQTQTKYLQVSRTVTLNGTNITQAEVQKVLSSTSGLNILDKNNECFNSKS